MKVALDEEEFFDDENFTSLIMKLHLYLERRKIL
jgi:hypothetical protein